MTGREVLLQAVAPPDEPGPLRAVLNGEMPPDALPTVVFHLWTRRENRGPLLFLDDRHDPVAVRVADAVATLLHARHGVSHRRCDLDRRFRSVEWLLARCDGGDPVPAHAAVKGDRPTGPPGRGGQGFPIRWTPPDVVRELAAWLRDVDPAAVAVAYDAPAMFAAGLYKCRADGDDWERRVILGFVADLRGFYRTAAHGDAVLIVED